MDQQSLPKETIEQCRTGQEQAFEQLVDMYAGRCYAYFYRLSGNRDISSDLLSQLFVKLVRKIRLYKGGSFEQWLFTIASNIFNDHLRQRYRQQKLLMEKAQELKNQQSQDKSDEYLKEKLQEKLLALDTETAELLTLRFYGQLSFKEIAQMRNEPIGTTLSKVHRGLKKLRQLMET